MPEVRKKTGAPRHVARWSLVAAWATAAMALSASAAGAELQLKGPPTCADGQELGFRVERALGRPIPDAAPLRVDVTVSRVRTRWSARIEMVDEVAHLRTERTIGGRDCAELVDAITVVIALALDSSTSTTTPASRAPSLGLDPSRAAPEPIASVSDGDVAEASRPTPDSAQSALAGEQEAVVPAVSLGVVGDAGSLPAPGLGLSLGGELAAGYWRLRALGTLLVDQRHQLGSSQAPGAELRLATGALLGCVLPTRELSSALQVRACAGWELGQLSGVGTGVAAPRTQTALWSAPLTDLGLLWAVPATRLRLEALLLVAMPLGRDEFVLRDVGHVHRAASIVGRAMLGAAFALD